MEGFVKKEKEFKSEFEMALKKINVIEKSLDYLDLKRNAYTHKEGSYQWLFFKSKNGEYFWHKETLDEGTVILKSPKKYKNATECLENARNHAGYTGPDPIY